MGGGTWVTKAFSDYTIATKCCTVDDLKHDTRSAQEFYKSRKIDAALDPHDIIRECRDSEEHPNTLPVILAIDCTGSMGKAAVETAKRINDIMTNIYENGQCKDVEFCVMGIGDCAYDSAPVQISQFESDIRIAEQLDKIYFEGRGGGNSYESYSAAWYMGTHRCKLDCWNRGKKGIIITLGDELPNPYLPSRMFNHIGNLNSAQHGDVETKELLREAQEKFDIYHISVKDRESSYSSNNAYYNLDASWKKLLGDNNYFVSTIPELDKIIANIIISHDGATAPVFVGAAAEAEVSW